MTTRPWNWTLSAIGRPRRVKIQEESSAADVYLNIIMGSLFIEGEADQALAERGARKTVINKKLLAIFSLIFSRLEMLSRTSHQQKIELEEVLPKRFTGL
jgi:hypothetical protein